MPLWFCRFHCQSLFANSQEHLPPDQMQRKFLERNGRPWRSARFCFWPLGWCEKNFSCIELVCNSLVPGIIFSFSGHCIQFQIQTYLHRQWKLVDVARPNQHRLMQSSSYETPSTLTPSKIEVALTRAPSTGSFGHAEVSLQFMTTMWFWGPSALEWFWFGMLLRDRCLFFTHSWLPLGGVGAKGVWGDFCKVIAIISCAKPLAH